MPMRSLAFCVCVSLLAVLAGCTGTGSSSPKKYFVLTGDSVASNDEAVGEAQLAINEALKQQCVPISIGGGTGAGVGLGLCSNPDFPKNPHELPPCLERQEVGSTFNVHVLVECPLSAPDLLSNGLPVP